MNAPHYYNELDPKAAAWLRELMRSGLIPDGHVDERSIADVRGGDLAGYVQCHFFAGIGGWSLALRLADWPADVPVWTGSCPCQPFSTAGKGLGTKDPRHLWPEFRRLIAECRPATVFGEQVASRAGREWLAGVCADVEGLGYAAAGADLCAAGVGAPQIRQRLYWVAYAQHGRRGWAQLESVRDTAEGWGGTQSAVGRGQRAIPAPQVSQNGRLADAANQRRNGSAGMQGTNGRHGAEAGCADCRLADADLARFHLPPQTRERESNGFADSVRCWCAFDLLPCRDGKTRRIEPSSFPLADGVPARVVRLRGYGNAIVPQVAAVFIRASAAATRSRLTDPVHTPTPRKSLAASPCTRIKHGPAAHPNSSPLTTP